jgi:HD-GYP domain-containing protein (c-di-GMP phosphodiesterase class II)
MLGLLCHYTKKELVLLTLGALLHDLGKINIPVSILTKNTGLREDEFNLVKKHPLDGARRIMSMQHSLPSPSVLAAIASEHHEHLDGTGYPRGLTAEKIHRYALIVAIADVYDALTSERPYKKAQSPKEAIEFLMNNAGKMFQPEYVKAFITYIPVYPKGRNVILSDGNVAVVVENRQYHTLYPVVRRLSDGETIDLADQNENLSDPLSILDFER